MLPSRARAAIRLIFFVVVCVTLTAGGTTIGACEAIALCFARGRHTREDVRLRHRFAKARFMRRMLSLLCDGIGVQVHLDAQTRRLVQGSHPKPMLALANHVSYLDVAVMGALLETGFLGKHEVSRYPLIGRMGRVLGMLFVDRDSLPHRVRMLLTMRRVLEQHSLCVFPEGTTTNKVTPEAGVWQAGQLWSARQHATRVVAFGLNYIDQDHVAWVGDDSLLPHLWKVLSRAETHIFVSAREVPACASGLETVRAFSQRVHASVSALCLQSHTRAALFRQIRAERDDAHVTEEASPCKSTR